ncbi:acyl-CoA thioesterase [Piscinibacter sp.]|jgi:4-hydroxybenzoyl-CoA thioesterase|uniref:acyl-CoA thioesterase n=1 Tax=Piscinibacter sp. TaxID=1903157 RepID=UPI00355ACAFE
MTKAGRFERCQRIRFSDCDPAGIVFYPQYFVMLNGLVEDWVTDALGIPYAELLGPRRIGMPTVSLQTEFRAISRMGDEVTFGLGVEHLGSRSLILALDGRCGGEERVRTRQVIVTTSLDTHQAVALPPDLRAAIERFCRQE